MVFTRFALSRAVVSRVSNLISYFPTRRAGLVAGLAIAAALTAPGFAQDQTALPPAATQPAASQTPDATQPAPGVPTGTLSTPLPSDPAQRLVVDKRGKAKAPKVEKDAKVTQTKDTKRELLREKKNNPLAGVDAKLPDKQLYDKAQDAVKHGRYDVARLDLQTLLNTYPDTQFQMRAKLAIAESWYKEGGTAALAQAEQEYKDFITFFPNVPEAAEAQMRVGDIYFRQMDKPDRDYARATHAQEEYRAMLTQFPDSVLVPKAEQRLREVQEVLATREAAIAGFYVGHQNWAAVIARYQTVVDTYPLYSHMDEALVGLGDAYEAQAQYVRTLKLPEGPKQRLEKIYDDDAIAAYTKVVMEHSAALHVDDARDRLEAMNVPMPKPSAEQMKASAALENSRAQYRLTDKARLLVLHTPDVVEAARIGDPPMVDPKPTIAPTIAKNIKADFESALNPNAVLAVAPVVESDASSAAAAGSDAATTAPAEAPSLTDIAPADNNRVGGATSVVTNVPDDSKLKSGYPGQPSRATSTGLGVEIITPGSAPDLSGGLKPVGPPRSDTIAPVERAEDAPAAVNDITPGSTPAAQAAPAKGKVKTEFDKQDESSSKHKPKKGIKKLDPLPQ